MVDYKKLTLKEIRKLPEYKKIGREYKKSKLKKPQLVSLLDKIYNNKKKSLKQKPKIKKNVLFKDSIVKTKTLPKLRDSHKARRIANVKKIKEAVDTHKKVKDEYY